MSKFNKGDIVRITRATASDSAPGNERWAGRTATVLDDTPAGVTRIRVHHMPPGPVALVGERERDWHTEWLELVESQLELVERPGIVEGSVLDQAYQRFARARAYGEEYDLIVPAAEALIDALLETAGLPQIDIRTNASRQAYIETGRFMYEGEEA